MAKAHRLEGIQGLSKAASQVTLGRIEIQSVPPPGENFTDLVHRGVKERIRPR